MLRRRTFLTAAAAAPFVPAAPYVARAAEAPGVTATEIRIGSMAAYSGPASAYSAIGRAHTATFKWLNDQGGVGGRKVNFLSYDDSYSPPKAVEQVRRLVEQDTVACLSNTLGTASCAKATGWPSCGFPKAVACWFRPSPGPAARSR